MTLKKTKVSDMYGEKCDWCLERADFNTEVRIAPTDTHDEQIWGRMKICPKCRETVTIKNLYEFIIG